jgi:hypothetical protein
MDASCVSLEALRSASRIDGGRVVLVVVTDLEPIERDPRDLAGDLRESGARELCARCGFTFLGPIAQSGGVKEAFGVSKTQAKRKQTTKQNSGKTGLPRIRHGRG